MKKKIFPIFIGITFILIMAGLSGCFSNEDEGVSEIDKFVGAWSQQGSDLWHELTGVTSLVFSSDRIFTTNDDRNGTYSLSEGKLVLTFDEGGPELSFRYQFSNANQMLTLVDSGENTAAYAKQ